MTIHFALVGGGWRAAFYLRVAQALPEQFAVDGVVVRDAAKGAVLAQSWGVRVFSTLDELLRAAKPHYVIACVPWEANPGLVQELAARGVAVLSETPPAPDVARLTALQELVKRGARIQVAEQYIYQPHHAARLALVKSGALGIISQAQVSACHGYHGASLLRHFLDAACENARVTATRFTSPLIAGPGRSGPPVEERTILSTQTVAWLDYGDRLGVYDFVGDQYFSWVRGQRLLVRGEKGEIIDQEARYLADYRTPITLHLRREVAGAEGNLEGMYLKGILAGERWLYRNPLAPARLSDDEIAVGTVMLKMGEYVEGGAEVYALAEACQDRYLDIVIEQAAKSGESVMMQTQPWAL
jgi:predicted dehydrogenase